MKKINIAIDGPVASGKTSVARELSKRMNYSYIDTGAMYRALTWKALRQGIDPLDEEKITSMAENTEINIVPSLESIAGYLVFMDGINVSERLNEPEVRKNVSPVASVSPLRKILVEKQKKMALSRGVIMAGRDITTVVIPEAEVKIFLTATPEERARRRLMELIDKGENISYESVLKEIKRRDHIDSTRADSPLIKAPDAVEVDCSDKTLEEVVEEIFIIAMNAAGAR
ncbi:MAG TPA: (d)CMP kinase [Candidatus Eremiobacteraeota bacterium]|nr:(d)CMP kinase [Candidatus Eremiobacteraeota bacterium]